ncbi:MAG: hypothetical protein ACM3O9_00115 [Methylocystaceae bacterium]
MQIYADLHIHLGSALGQAVKITASRQLTLDSVVYGAQQKGLAMVGIVDAGCLGVMAEISDKLEQGEWYQLAGGGFRAEGITIIPGCELETCEGIHVLSFFPGWQQLREFCRWWQPQVTNPRLSTQRGKMGIKATMEVAHKQQGVFGFAHAFTPHKGVYGCLTPRLANLLGDQLTKIDFIELGLSADAGMARSITECQQFAFLSNSDAHSLPNLAREYNRLEMTEPSFQGLVEALAAGGQGIIANYGLHPLLGKYYRTFCPPCSYIVDEAPPVSVCPRCGNRNIVMGVKDRITMIADQENIKPDNYYYRVPLLMVPGIGKRTAARLVTAGGSELAVMEEIPESELEKVAGKRATDAIAGIRQQRFKIIAGGGGRYGHLTPDNNLD